MVVNIQAAGQMYKQRSEERTGKWERTEYTDEKEQMEYTYEKAKNEKAKIRELYIWMTKHIFGTSLSHNFLKLCHVRVCKTKLLEVNYGGQNYQSLNREKDY